MDRIAGCPAVLLASRKEFLGSHGGWGTRGGEGSEESGKSQMASSRSAGPFVGPQLLVTLLPHREAGSHVGGGAGESPVARMSWLSEIKSWREAHVPGSPGGIGGPVPEVQVRREGEQTLLQGPSGPRHRGRLCPAECASAVGVWSRTPARLCPKLPSPKDSAGGATLGVHKAARLMGCEWATGQLQTGAHNKALWGRAFR